MRVVAALVALLWVSWASGQTPETVTFPSGDGATQLVGYLFKPPTPGPSPAVVMLHGRAGPYSSAANGVFAAETLSKRHKEWGRFWAERGYLGLHVDSFGPRGHARGFPIHSYAARPAEVDEVTVRPLDAYGALRFLRARPDVIPDRIGLHGWSNGGSATLSAMAVNAPGITDPSPATGFRAALSFYPGCALKNRYRPVYKPYAPLLLLAAGEDEEVSPARCEKLVAAAKAAGGGAEIVVYAGAQHAFDDPGEPRQSREANRAATLDAKKRVEEFFGRHLKR